MHRFHRFAFALGLVALAPMSVAQAQIKSDKSDQLIKNFYAKLGTLIRGEDKSDTMLCLSTAGIFVQAMSSDSVSDKMYLNSLLDITPEFNPVYRPGKRSFSAVYGDIVNLKKADPDRPLSPEEQKKLANALKFTAPDSQVMKEYQEAEDQYIAAVDAMESERWENLANGKGLKSSRETEKNVKRARDYWNGHGKRGQVEGALGEIQELTNFSSSAWWYRTKNAFENAKTGNLADVTTFPPPETWGSDSGWSRFTYRASDKRSQKSLNTRDVSTSAKLKFGFFSAGGNGRQATRAEMEMASDESLTISMEFKRVLIHRPWMDWNVFRNEHWTWVRGTDSSGKDSLISDGKGKGIMPLYVDALILVRNVVFSGESVSSFKEEKRKEVEASGRAGYGPFSIKTNYKSLDEDGREEGQTSENEFSIPDPQIIGYACTIVPKCPAKTVK